MRDIVPGTSDVNDWKVHKNGQANQSRLVELLGRNPAADLSRLRKEFEDEFRTGLEEAEKRAKGLQRARGG